MNLEWGGKVKRNPGHTSRIGKVKRNPGHTSRIGKVKRNPGHTSRIGQPYTCMLPCLLP